VIIWGKDTKEARQRAKSYVSRIEIEGEDPKGEPIITNLEYLHERLDDILRFDPEPKESRPRP
jgi:hypothetical protein